MQHSTVVDILSKEENPDSKMQRTTSSYHLILPTSIPRKRGFYIKLTIDQTLTKSHHVSPEFFVVPKISSKFGWGYELWI